MKQEYRKYVGGATHRMALLHAVGQLGIVNGGIVSIADVMPFMKVSKPTAIKVLKNLAKRDELIMIKNPNVGNFGKWEFCLHDDMQVEFDEGIYKPYFDIYVEGVIYGNL